eukprot:TRINITY_DN16827_c0_g4_i1.p1 TRINITY_DN16827_c0_g4~~TRINITY_DN16827_c0_g4_i1.p1  ORF type:complete len:388 (+),score=27.65 TRINITY_DN16827_c0_g4_i1:48-1211(+)
MSTTMLCRHTLLFLAWAACVDAHGMLIVPPSRNSMDKALPEFKDGAFTMKSDGCNCADISGGCPAGLGPRAGGNGQPCLWFQQGCTIGCPKCTLTRGHYNASACENPTVSATVNDPKWRTMNLDAEAGSADDVYRFNPWRAPGAAPVQDACGIAGGSDKVHLADAAVFQETKFAKFGDYASKSLPQLPTGVVWAVGSVVEVAWGIRYNHGGGYSYRLCPVNEELTEECFRKIPLNFTGMPSLRWNNGKELFYKPMYLTEGTSPPGSMWARNQIPRIDDSAEGSWEPWDKRNLCQDGARGKGCRAFEPICEEATPPWHKIEPQSRDSDVEGICSGDWTGGMLVDRVQIPTWLPPGQYVLGWRWDCEETAQVWTNCADVTVAAKDDVIV